MKTHRLLILAALTAASTGVANIIHDWEFNDTAGTLMTAAANTGSVGAINFAGGNAGWTTDGAGSLRIQSASGDSLIQSNANMGALAGQFSIQYDMSWNFASATLPNHREMFLISRTASGANPSGNQFRFSMTVYSGTSNLFIAHQSAGHTGAITDPNYRNQIVIADLATNPAGSVSLKVNYAWNPENTQLSGISAEYSMDGTNWNPYALEGTFTPYNISDLGDLRIHAKGNFDTDDYYAVDRVSVTVVPEPATVALLLGLGVLGFTAWRRRR